jgi:UDP-3-O-[3-hydroxymyristoyl] glucosamine N-acyltransferase
MVIVGAEGHGMEVLINARADVHHEYEIGSFSEIETGAVLLDAVEIGVSCRI